MRKLFRSKRSCWWEWPWTVQFNLCFFRGSEAKSQFDSVGWTFVIISQKNDSKPVPLFPSGIHRVRTWKGFRGLSVKLGWDVSICILLLGSEATGKLNNLEERTLIMLSFPFCSKNMFFRNKAWILPTSEWNMQQYCYLCILECDFTEGTSQATGFQLLHLAHVGSHILDGV